MSVIRRLAFHVTILIYVGGHVVVFGVRGDTVDEIIGNLRLALAGLCAVSTVDKFFSLFNEFMWIDSEDF